MNATMGNAALRSTNSSTQASDKIDMVQVNYIYSSFELALNLEIMFDKKGNPVPTGLEPLIIKRNMYRLPAGYANLIELHGYYTKDVAERAIFRLKDEGQLQEDILTEMVTDKKGMVTAIKFIQPVARVTHQ
ncbi:MAG: hypothetical protein IJ629_06360 [Clostridia bacterium]|nr:hypothetical protein [Clostridia bacterium]